MKNLRLYPKIRFTTRLAKSHQHRCLIILVLLAQMLLVSEVRAQNKPDWTSSDITTYRQFLNSSWDSLIITGNNHLKSGIDYQYLRLRLGIAYYEKQNYAMAIRHFTKALDFNPTDALAIEYLYFANLFINNDFEAKLWARCLSQSRLVELGIKSRFIEGYSSDITYNVVPSNPIPEVSNSTATGSQQIPKNFINANLSLKHFLSPRFKIVHGYTFLYKNSEYYLKGETTSSRYTDYILQNQYYISGIVYPFKGLQISAAYHQLWISVPITSSGSGMGRRNSASSSFSTTSDYSFSVSALQSFGYFDLGYTYTQSGLNRYKQKQHSLQFGIYPLGNLNLYLLNRVIFFNENSDLEKYSIIVGGTLGFKVAKHLWAEANILGGTIKNLSDYGSYIIYNDVNTIKLKTGFSFLFPLNSGTILSLRASHYNAESVFSDNQSVDNKINYSSVSITGGITWNF